MENAKRSAAIRQLAANIDNSRYIVEDEGLRESFSEGAGAGVGVKDLFQIGESDRGRGKTRIFHVFNSVWTERNEITEITIWDWNGDLRNLAFYDDEGNHVDYQFVDRGFMENWGHFYLRVLLAVSVPPMGYSTYIMKEKGGDMNFLSADDHYLTRENLPPNELHSITLENERLKAVLDTRSLSLISLIDKESGKEYADRGRSGALFRFIEEDAFNGGGNAWLIGRYGKVEPLTEGQHIEGSDLGMNKIRQSVAYRVPFRNSSLRVTISLDRGNSRLDYQVECDWHEYGRKDEFTPQLQFIVPLGYECETYKYDTAFGTVARKPMDIDVPANSWAVGMPQGKGKGIMMVTDSKYGFRGVDQSLSVTLLRGSYAPDPHPDTGTHTFRLAICLTDCDNNVSLIEESYRYQHPLSHVSVRASKGAWPTKQSFFHMEEGTAAISAIKVPEEGNAAPRWIIRAYETEGQSTVAKLDLYRNVKKAYWVDTLERNTGDEDIQIDGTSIRFPARAYCVVNLCIEFAP
ncbi:glycoside hydrolase family 38 C-terminal domain-containing protein [Paenibacillus sp. LHD-38]|uniref:glycoside hydrolase family 38 C-terminal domain-containing protein n=1 Tax=Paenibacillus sp. LHD-38 TaxID=3072143 RepID=UPI00280F5AD2|nr:glycoside hydrolase family 38 C-terminal domain-containing protein [Paenibacillus sp. LHD-38]MDQ8734718.1 glycoside hydrolase family 38 C-terminal domain-containing protein [Paenibacillus sp. LHD-38]